LIKVIVPDGLQEVKDCAGEYAYIDGETYNGQPMYRRSWPEQRLLYASSKGNWTITGTRADAEKDSGFMDCTSHHNGQSPTKMLAGSWRAMAAAGGLESDPGVVVCPPLSQMCERLRRAAEKTFDEKSLHRSGSDIEILAPAKSPGEPVSFEKTNYHRLHSQECVLKRNSQVWTSVRATLVAYYKFKGKDVVKTEHFAKMLEDYKGWQASDPATLKELLQSPAFTNARAWTADVRNVDFDLEWCGILQDILRLDDCSLLQAALPILVTLNAFCVQSRGGTVKKFIVQWPTITDDDREAWTLFHGGRLPEAHAQWYKSRIGEVHRVNMALPTSPKKGIALKFMQGASYPDDKPTAFWTYRLDSFLMCKHVNCLESVTCVANEQEFIFPLWDDERQLYMIELKMLPENKPKAFNGPPADVPTAPWC